MQVIELKKKIKSLKNFVSQFASNEKNFAIPMDNLVDTNRVETH